MVDCKTPLVIAKCYLLLHFLKKIILQPNSVHIQCDHRTKKFPYKNFYLYVCYGLSEQSLLIESTGLSCIARPHPQDGTYWR